MQKGNYQIISTIGEVYARVANSSQLGLILDSRSDLAWSFIKSDVFRSSASKFVLIYCMGPEATDLEEYLDQVQVNIEIDSESQVYVAPTISGASFSEAADIFETWQTEGISSVLILSDDADI